MSAREPKLLVVREGLGSLLANNDRARRASQVNLMLPCEQSREPQRAEGAPRNTPPKSSWLSPIVGTREIPGRMIRMVEVGRREPYENPIPSWEVGRGIVVGGQESCPHEDEDSWRRPLACGKTGPEVPSERASCPRGKHCGAGEMGRNASCAHGEGPQVLSRIP